MRALLARLRDAFRRRTLTRSFDEEIEFHLAELERAAIDRGESPEQARLSAARAFGNVTRTRESLRAQAGFPTWDEFVDDLRYAARGLLRRPALSGSVVLILALGLGAAATLYGLIDAIFLRPLPVQHPEQLYAVVGADPARPSRLSRGTVRRLEESLPPGSVAAYHSGGRATIQIGNQPAFRASTRAVNGEFFATLGLVPAAGRLLSPADDVVGNAAAVVVVSSAWAKANFGTALAALGQELRVNQVPVVIVGVLPESFRDITVGQFTDLWFAAALQPRVRIFGNFSEEEGDDRPNDPDWNREERVSWLEILLRSRPGALVTPAILQRAWEPQRDELAKALSTAGNRDDVMHRGWRLVPAPGGRSRFREAFHSVSWILAGIVGIMLVLVCINVSGLLLVRSMSRHREIGVRLALGAGSLRVARSACLEALLLSGAGALAGYLLASGLLPLAARLLGVGQGLGLAVDLRLMLAMTVLTLVTAFLSAIGPAFWISRVQPLKALSGHRGIGRAPIRFGRILVVAQFALAVALVALAAALGEDLQRALAADPGFERDQVLTASFDPSSAGYRGDAVMPLIDRLRATALGVPGVKRVGFAYTGILVGSQWHSGLNFRDPRVHATEHSYQMDIVTPGYFATTGTPLLLGRDFETTDAANAQPVAVVSASFARQVFGDVNPLGQLVGYDSAPSKRDFRIVGVVADVHANGVRERAPALLYTSALQANGELMQFLAVRFDGAEAPVLRALRSAFARTEPGVVFTGWATLHERMTGDLGQQMATMRLTFVFGGCALLLAAVGVAGSLGYLVTLRQRELALRMAVGADPARLLAGVMKDALRLCAFGSLAGILVVSVLPLVPAAKALLVGGVSVGPAILAAAAALVAAALGGFVPARRAARIDPLVTLRAE